MMYLNNLLLIMSACGSAAFVVYLAAKHILRRRLTPTYRYHLLQLVLAFYLLPVPLLANRLQQLLCNIFRNQELFAVTSPPGEPIWQNLYKTIYIKDGHISLPAIDILLLCVIVLAVLVIICYLLYYRYRSRQEKQLALLYAEKDTNVEELLPSSYQTLLHRRHVAVYTGSEDGLAFTCGARHPTVILAANEQADQQRLILMHELTHIRYWDVVLRGLSFLALALHFFNPLAYLLFHEIRQCTELHCDEKVLQGLSEEERIAYGHLLINNALQARTSPFATPFADNSHSTLKERITLIKSPGKKRILAGIVTAAVMIPTALLPALAYDVPDLIINGPAEEDPAGVDWAYCIDGEATNDCPDDEQYFSDTVDAYYIDEDGTVTILSDIATNATCTKHTYTASTLYRHTKNSSGGCTVKKYSCKRCKNCGYITNKKLLQTNTYTTCPHK